MDQERIRARGAIERAAGGECGRPYTAQRLAWLLYGAAGWRIRAIISEEGFRNCRSSDITGIVLETVARGKVRHIIAVYLKDLEKSMMLAKDIARV